MQKFPAPEFEVTTVFRFSPAHDGDVAGLVVFGHDYAWIGVRRVNGRLAVIFARCLAANRGGEEQELSSYPLEADTVHLKVSVSNGGICRFYFSEAGDKFAPVDPKFSAVSSSWVGAKVGLFAAARGTGTKSSGHVNVDGFRVTRLGHLTPSQAAF
jgi:beta-xylosidase